jgi:hypothetical protein
MFLFKQMPFIFQTPNSSVSVSTVHAARHRQITSEHGWALAGSNPSETHKWCTGFRNPVSCWTQTVHRLYFRILTQISDSPALHTVNCNGQTVSSVVHPRPASLSAGTYRVRPAILREMIKKTPCIINSFTFYIRTAQTHWHSARTYLCIVNNFRRPYTFHRSPFSLFTDWFISARNEATSPAAFSAQDTNINNYTLILFTVNKIQTQNKLFKNKFPFTIPDIRSTPTECVSTVQMCLLIAHSLVAPYSHSRLGV